MDVTPQQGSLSGVIICPPYAGTAVKGELLHRNTLSLYDLAAGFVKSLAGLFARGLNTQTESICLSALRTHRKPGHNDHANANPAWGYWQRQIRPA
jgi:hypothetical protein